MPWDFPGGPVIKNSPSNAGDVGSIPDEGTNILPAVGLLNLHAIMKNPKWCNQEQIQPWIDIKKKKKTHKCL